MHFTRGCLSRGCVCPGGCLPRGVSAQGGVCPEGGVSQHAMQTSFTSGNKCPHIGNSTGKASPCSPYNVKLNYTDNPEMNIQKQVYLKSVRLKISGKFLKLSVLPTFC